VTDQLWELSEEIGELFEHIGSFGQVISLLEPHYIVDKQPAKELNVKEATIEFRNVNFNYSTNGRLRDSALFRNKSIIIPARQKVGLVGYSGSGKTTFTSLIARLHEIDHGEILIDNQNITEVTQESLRKNISIIPQDPVLFNRTIMENIRYGKPDATDDEVFVAAGHAHIHAFISAQSQGYDTMCGERGGNLSGGQRQRIVIARAILRNSPILVLDEATSSLDSHTEKLIQQSLEKLFVGKTVLVIAHRLSTLIKM
jgi:ABC-type multidrug transport system fused ATPase/permease subunit